ncbi:hypothetical protein [Sediminibacterium sp.]|uniref:hypothetical protein n=1 Tax=Sediminibacterium sp. TaxID=1917865 RepID=UPI003F705EAA
MQNNINYNSTEILENIVPAHIDGAVIDANFMNNLSREIEKTMEKFEIEKRNKQAQSLNELSMLVITA